LTWGLRKGANQQWPLALRSRSLHVPASATICLPSTIKNFEKLGIDAACAQVAGLSGVAPIFVDLPAESNHVVKGANDCLKRRM